MYSIKIANNGSSKKIEQVIIEKSYFFGFGFSYSCMESDKRSFRPIFSNEINYISLM